MRILKGLLLLTMFAVAVAYWAGSRPKQEIDLSQPAASGGEMEPKDPIEFSLTDKKGGIHKLSSMRGKPIIVNFWATWCPPCLEELPAFLKFAEWARQTLGAEVIAISVDQNWKLVDKFFAEKKLWPSKELPLTILLDADAKVAGSYGSSKFPETFFIDRNFKIVRKFVGVQDWTSQEITTWVMDHSK